jgi:Flp pilus assembly protein TadB
MSSNPSTSSLCCDVTTSSRNQLRYSIDTLLSLRRSTITDKTNRLLRRRLHYHQIARHPIDHGFVNSTHTYIDSLSYQQTYTFNPSSFRLAYSGVCVCVMVIKLYHQAMLVICVCVLLSLHTDVLYSLTCYRITMTTQQQHQINRRIHPESMPSELHDAAATFSSTGSEVRGMQEADLNRMKVVNRMNSKKTNSQDYRI